MSVQEHSEDRFEILSDVFLEFSNHQKERGEDLIASARPVISDWTESLRRERERNRQESHFYNPLADISIRETDHSRLLGTLLDPRGTHGQGRLFLNSFLRLVGISDPEKDEWAVTVEVGRVDLVIRRKNPNAPSVVIVENKVNGAGDQSSQLYRYWYQEMYRPYPDLGFQSAAVATDFKIVYLPERGTAGPSEQSLRRPQGFSCPHDIMPLKVDVVGFDPHIIRWLSRCSKELPGDNIRLKIFLKFYTELWSHAL